MGNASSVSEALVGGFITGTQVTVNATNSNDFGVKSKGGIKGLAEANTGAAAAIVVSKVDSQADAVVSGTVHSTGSVDVHSESVNLNNDSDARAKVKRNPLSEKGIKGKVSGKIAGKLSTVDLTAVSDAGAISFGASVVFADSSNRADARIDSDARVFCAG